jgi:competence protein ComFC
MVISLEGNWRAGKAYDLHTMDSTYLGADELGHDRFDNTRSEMGELLYRLKYRGDKSATERMVELLDGIEGIENFDCIIPVPATKKDREYQPVDAIAEALGKRRGIKGELVNEGDDELKGITDPVARNELLENALNLAGSVDLSGKRVLLVDDLYRSGSTLRVATMILYEHGGADDVCVLTMTKTRSNR